MIREELLIVQQESYCISVAAALRAALENKMIFTPQLFVKIDVSLSLVDSAPHLPLIGQGCLARVF